MVITTRDLLSQINSKRHLLVWILITVFICLIDPVVDKFSVQLAGTFLIIFGYMFVYYSLFLFTFRLFTLHKLKFLILLILTFLIYFGIDFINFCYVIAVYNVNGQISFDGIYYLAKTDFILFSIIAIMSYGAFQNKVSILKLQKEYEKEKILLNKELGFYKNQFNSHITFNFLNYCFSFVNTKSPETAYVIELYSEMLRYSINCKSDETVSLQSEVDYINKFISLKRQLSKGIYVNFLINGDLRNKSILPRILITFIENAFKHGETHRAESPINININVIENEIKFCVSNMKNTSKNKPISTGIGQVNVKKQLELFYKNNYELNINEDLELYTTTLIIKN